MTMIIPNLKRIKCGSERSLHDFLAKPQATDQDIMLVTFAKTVPAKHLTLETIQAALNAHGWQAGPRYTLSRSLVGHVIRRRDHR